MMDGSVAANLELAALPEHARGISSRIEDRGLRQRMSAIKEQLDIKSHDLWATPVRTLSGGNQQKVTFAVYCLCSAFAAIGGFISISQAAAAPSTFGEHKEFLVIAAAVLGGTSLFGGHGGLLGPVFGAILIQTVQNGLVMIDADPYIYPLITAAIIFIAVLVDSLRASAIARLERRRIRVEEEETVEAVAST